MRSVFVKQGPMVFLKDVLIMECLAIILLFAASFIENYEMLYQGSNLNDYIRYDLFILVASSLFQLFYLIVLFINWYFSYFEIKDNEIVRKSGILFHRRKSVRLSNIVSVETYESPLDRLIHHATIRLEHQNGRITEIQNVSNYNEYVNIIKRAVQSASKNFSKSILNLLKQGESADLEFKETLRYDTRRNEVNKELEKAIIKSIVGFLNTEGGNLLVGVNDDGKVVGLAKDYESLPKKNRDGFENHLTMLFKTMVGIQFIKHIDVSFESIPDRDLKDDVCLVSVQSSHKPAYLKNSSTSGGQAGKEEFFVRVGNSTQPFSMSETEEYIRTHFKD